MGNMLANSLFKTTGPETRAKANTYVVTPSVKLSPINSQFSPSDISDSEYGTSNKRQRRDSDLGLIGPSDLFNSESSSLLSFIFCS